MTMATLQTTGITRTSPGPAAIGFALTLEDNTSYSGGCFIGETSSSVAEYSALIWGMENALDAGVDELSIEVTDGNLVRQLNGEIRVRNEGLKPLFVQARQMLSAFGQTVLSQVADRDSTRAAELATEALASYSTIGEYLSQPTMKQSLKTLADEREHEGEVYEMSYLPDMSYGAVPAGEGKRREVAFGDLADDEAPQGAPAEPEGDSRRNRTNSFIAATEEPSYRRAASEPYSDRITEAVTSIHRDATASGLYELTVRDSFNAAHALRGYRGPAKDLHGHTINVEVSVEGSKLDHVGILYDARKLKTDVRSVLGRYANTYLNEVEPFDKINSTPENIARVVYEAVDAILPEHVRTTEVSVWSTPDVRMRYHRTRIRGTQHR